MRGQRAIVVIDGRVYRRASATPRRFMREFLKYRDGVPLRVSRHLRLHDLRLIASRMMDAESVTASRVRFVNRGRPAASLTRPAPWRRWMTAAASMICGRPVFA